MYVSLTPYTVHSTQHHWFLIQVATVCLFALIIYSPSADASYVKEKQNIRDLFYGEALYYAYQEDYFSAVSRFDTELTQHYSLDDPRQDSLSYHREESEFYIGDMELSYRMHRKVGRAMKRLLNKSVHITIRDRAAYRLARIAFKKSSFEDALAHLNKISKDASEDLQLKAELLRGQSLIALDRHAEAIKVLQPIHGKRILDGYAPYNLGIALLGAGDQISGFKILDKVGRSSGSDMDRRALQDKANLTIGFTLLTAKKPLKARPYLERIHLKGAFSNKALLWVGWSNAAQGKYEQALVPWMMLRKRDVTDVAVQEALLAAPYGFSQLKAHGRSAILYGEAVETFDREMNRVDDSIRSIREGKFLKAMLHKKAAQEKQWLFSMRELPDAPETRYLRNLMAGHVFNESYSNYRDLDYLSRNINQWLQNLPTYQKEIEARRRYYAPLLPKIESRYGRAVRRLSKLETRHKEISSSLKGMLRKRKPLMLATADEKVVLRQLDNTESKINRLSKQPGLGLLKDKQDRLSGLLHWRLNTEYDNRLSRAHQHARELEQAIEQARRNQRILAQRKSEAVLSYQGYAKAIQDLHSRLQYLKTKLAGITAHQGKYMERRAIAELSRRKQRLRRYRNKARFAMAESYDRALRNNPEKKQ